MSWVRIWVHLVFSTKDRIPFLNSNDIRRKIFEHIIQNAKEKDIWLDSINGYTDHVHCLLSLNKDQSISKVSQLLKGESSNWINKNKIVSSKFLWQDDYWAVSVSEGHIESVRNYIKQQDEHHKIKSFDEEVKSFMDKYGWSVFKDK